jgi:hypothetical protein
VPGRQVIAEPGDDEADALDPRRARLQPVERDQEVGLVRDGVQVLRHGLAGGALADRLRRTGELARGRDEPDRPDLPLGDIRIGEVMRSCRAARRADWTRARHDPAVDDGADGRADHAAGRGGRAPRRQSSRRSRPGRAEDEGGQSGIPAIEVELRERWARLQPVLGTQTARPGRATLGVRPGEGLGGAPKRP